MSTPRHAGFATVLTAGADLVDGMLAAAAALVPMPHFSLPDVIDVGSDAIGVKGKLQLLPPTVSFAANKDNLIGVTAGASGVLQLTANGGSLVEVEVTLSASFKVGLVVDVSASKLEFGLDLTDASVTSAGVKVEFGPPLAPVYEKAITSSSALSAYTKALQSVPQKSVTFTLPGATGTIDFSVSGVDLSLTVSRVVVVPLDGNVITIAADVSPYTTGDASKLVNLITTPSPGPVGITYNTAGIETGMTGGFFGPHTGFGTNLAATVNGTFLCAVVNGPISTQLAGKVIQKVTIGSVALALGSVESVIGQSDLPTNFYGSLTLTATGDYSGIGFTFEISATPIFIQQPTTGYWDMPVVAYSFGSSALAFLDVFFPFLPVIGPLILNSTIDSLIANVIAKLPSGLFAESGSQPFPGLSGWNLSYTVEGIVVWSAEVDAYVAAAVTGPSSPAPPAPAFALGAASHKLTDSSPIPVSLTVSDSALLNPLLGLRVTWSAKRDDTGASVLNTDMALTSAALTVDIDRWSGDLKYNDTWTVSCEVYRPADSLTPRYTYFNQSTKAGVTDVVDRHHPYVHWDHTAFFHNPAGPPPLKSHPLWSRSRKSRIHRTDILIRCEVLDGALESPPSRSAPVYVDTLSPFGTLDDVARWRHGVLCDYCFFGGPTRTAWKKPTPPTADWV